MGNELRKIILTLISVAFIIITTVVIVDHQKLSTMVNNSNSTNNMHTVDIPFSFDTTERSLWTSDSMPIILRITNLTSNKEIYQAVNADSKKDVKATVSVSPASEYAISIISPLNKDSSIFSPDTETLTIDSTNTEVEPVQFNYVDSKDVSKDELMDLAAQIRKAATYLKDTKLQNKVATIIINNPSITNDSQQLITTQPDEQISETTPDVDPQPETPAPQPQPYWVGEIGHWQQQTETVWVPNIVTIVDTPGHWEYR